MPPPLIPPAHLRPTSRHTSSWHTSAPLVRLAFAPSPGTPLPHRPATPPPHRPGTMGQHPGTPLVPARLRPSSRPAQSPGMPPTHIPARLRPSARHASLGPPTLVLARLRPIGPAHLHPIGPALWAHAPSSGTPPPLIPARPKSRHASAPHPACLCPIGPAHLCPIGLAHFRPIGLAHLRPSYLRAPGPPTRPASAPRPCLPPLLSQPLEAIANLSTRSQQKSYVTKIQQGRGRRRWRLSPASTACFHGVRNRTHSSSPTHSSSLNKCLHNFEGHSSTFMLLSCWRIKLVSNPKGSHSISTHCLLRLKQS